MKPRPSLKWDYLLAAVGGATAAYSVGMGVTSPEIAAFFAGLIIVGTGFSFVLHRWLDRLGGLWLGPILYVVACMATVGSLRQLNALTPAGGFPVELPQAMFMCWLLAVGSFFALTEGVLLFQAVPSIALFGMVGSWDTFRGAPFMFFAFLLCMAALLSRAHARAMLRQAEESGFSGLSRIRFGPWRWMAGPEWAIASAAVVILVSLLGAPVVQWSMSSVSGSVHIKLPASIVQASTTLSGIVNADRPMVDVGMGPLHPGDTVVLAVRLDQPRYLRDNVYDAFDGHSWSHSGMGMLPGDSIWREGSVVHRTSFAQRLMKDPQTVGFQVQVIAGAFNRVPAPAEVVTLHLPATDEQHATYDTGVPQPGEGIFRGESVVANESIEPKDAYRGLPDGARFQLTDPGATYKVLRLTQLITARASSDYDKAVAIKRYIESTVVYNLEADAVPRSANAVEYVLFNSKQGYCDLFATAMVSMARVVGIPARYATGYYPIRGETDGDGRTIIRASERHAWAELLFKDVGWVPFDATEGARAVEGNGRGSSGLQAAWFRQDWFRQILDLAMIALAAGAALFLWTGTKIGLAWLRRGAGAPRSPLLDAAEARRRVGRVYSGLVRDLEHASGRFRSPAETPFEFLAAVSGSLGSSGEQVRAVITATVDQLYAPGVRLETDVAAYEAQVRSTRRLVRNETRGSWVAIAKAKAASWAAYLRAVLRMRREN